MAWTVGVDDQTEFADSVLRWQAFHANISEAKSNKISPMNQVIVLLSHFYGRAKVLCKSIPDFVVCNEKRVEAIVGAFHKRDLLSVLLSVYGELITLMTAKRTPNETPKNFELRFNAELTRFNSLATNTALFGTVSAIISLANANVDANQKVSTLAAVSSLLALLKPLILETK